MDPKKKFYLFKQSNHFCSVPWNYIKVNMDGTVKTCVEGSIPLGNIHNQSISEILSNPVLKDIRETLYADNLHKNCETCQKFENGSNNKSYRYLRDLYNNYFVKNDIDYSNKDCFKLAGVDLHWGSTCNLKCVTCWARQSSSIAQEMGIPIISTSRQAADALIDWIIDNQANLKELYLSGGEPTLIRHNIRLLEKIEKTASILLRVNSNLTWDRNNIIVKEIMKFPNVLWTASADDIGERFDYIRHGAQWNQFIKNLDWLKGTHAQIRVNSVFFINTATRITETHEFFRERYQINDFTINQCEMEHPYLRPRNLSDRLKQIAREKISSYRLKYHADNNLQGQLETCLKELQHESNDSDYHSYFDDIDRKRGTNWRIIFPELTND